MKNIFVLTKNEQRVVIVVVMVMLAATLAKHFFESRPHPVPPTASSVEAATAARSTSKHPTAAPSPSAAEDE